MAHEFSHDITSNSNKYHKKAIGKFRILRLITNLQKRRKSLKLRNLINAQVVKLVYTLV